MTTRAEIRNWLKRGKADGATHLLVVCDTFDWDDYPVFATSEKEAREKAAGYPRDMQKLMEVYCLAMDWDRQLETHRSFNFAPEVVQ